MRTIVAGNWKMHTDSTGAQSLVGALLEKLEGLPNTVEAIVAPPFPYLQRVLDQTRGSRIKVAAQNCHQAEKGAFTGEVSAAMLADLGVQACIVGHSERRQYFGETDAAVGEKVAALLAHGLLPIYCCGERKEERESGRHFEVVTAQLKAGLGELSEADLERIVVAYEPVWAIGTGLTASAQQAQDMHAHLRGLLRSHGSKVAATVPILYGGSCKPDNAAELFANPDVNGGLIGGAALDADQFVAIVRAAAESIG